MSTAAQEAQDEVLAAITPAILAADVARMVRAPSPTGAERPAVQELAEIAEEHGLPARIDVHDLPALRRLAGCPGEGAARDELIGFDACLIPEATAFDVVSAHGGALTFVGTVRGVSAHAAVRLQGVSAIDRYLSVHAALAEHEREVNAAVADPLMAQLKLPYPLLAGRLSAGRWSSQVPDELEFEGRLGVAVGADLADARAAPGQTPMDDPFVALMHAGAREQCSFASPGRSPSRSCASGHSGH